MSDEEEEEDGAVNEQEEAQVEDIHDPLKIVLQRQFFEALVRATAVKFVSGTGAFNLNTLEEKLEHVFKTNF